VKQAKRAAVAIGVMIWMTAAALAQSLPSAKPSDAGFSEDRLARITKFFQGEIDKSAIPGVTLLIARDAHVVQYQAIGFQDREKGTPMKRDAIFRIASMSKPITSVAIMMLVEEGKIDLLAPVTQYLPEFKNVKVGVIKGEGANATLTAEDLQRPITVQDLLRHTSGLVYGPFGNTLVHQAYSKANLFEPNQTLAEFVTKITKLPLAHQPGTVWEYGMSTDVLGRIVEVVSGTSFDRFVEERITKPLGMRDTGFYLSAEQGSRLAQPLPDPAGQRRASGPADFTKEKVKWFSGGGGMLSTSFDYARFCQMLLDGGALGEVRLLSPKTVALMSSDALPPGIPRIGYEEMAPTPEMGQSFGLGFAVRTQPGHNPNPGSLGDFYWAGAYGTYFWIDPHEKLLAILMVQMPFPQSGPYRRAMRDLVYAALVH